MADSRGRSPEEREAARLERERRRLARSGRPVPPASPAPSPPAPSTPKPVPRAPEPAISTPRPGGGPASGTAPAAAGRGPPPLGPARRRSDRPAAAPPPLPIAPLGDGNHDDGGAFETGEHELELPSGTRRVSAREKPSVPRAPKSRTARKPRLPGQARRHSWLGRIASVVALALAGGVIWFLVQLFQPFGTSPHGSVTVTIAPKSTSSQIGDLLVRDGVISSAFFFEARATLAGERSSMRAGVYHLQLGMSYGAVLTKLTTPPPRAPVTEITIAEGRRRQQIDTLLRQQHVRGSYLAATRSTRLLNLRAYGLRHKPRSLEGFLFPDTYQVIKPVRIPTLVADQLRTFKQQFAKVALGYPRRKHLTPYDVLIIASLIEAETPTAHDRPLVASVIYNRLADGMEAGAGLDDPVRDRQLHPPAHGLAAALGLRRTTPVRTSVCHRRRSTTPDWPRCRRRRTRAQTGYLFFFAKPCGGGSVFATNYAQFLRAQPALLLKALLSAAGAAEHGACQLAWACSGGRWPTAALRRSRTRPWPPPVWAPGVISCCRSRRRCWAR